MNFEKHLNTNERKALFRINSGKFGMLKIDDLRTLKQAKALGIEIDNNNIKLGDDQNTIFKKYIGELKGFKAIGKEIGSDPRSFKNKITDIGIKIPPPGSTWKKMKDHYSGKFNISHSNFMKDLINGSLLGDANIRLQSKGLPHWNRSNFRLSDYTNNMSNINNLRQRMLGNGIIDKNDIAIWNSNINFVSKLNTANFRIHKSIKEIGWVKALGDEFIKAGYEITPFVKPSSPRNFDPQLKWTCGFDTKSSVQLFDNWLDWYDIRGKSTVKIIPNNSINLNPDTMLHWYVGDGWMSASKNIAIASHNFSKTENLDLVKELNKIGIGATVQVNSKQNKKGQKQTYIRLSSGANDRDNFFNYLKQAKLYNQAAKFTPQKFDENLSYDKYMENLKKSNPEFFDKNANLTWDKVIRNL